MKKLTLLPLLFVRSIKLFSIKKGAICRYAYYEKANVTSFIIRLKNKIVLH